MQAGVGVFAVRSLFRMAYMYGPPTSENAAALRRFVWEVSLSTGFGTVAWGLVAAYHWRMYRRWGRVPRVLAANREGMILTRLGWWRMRERRWAASEIAAVELRPTRLNPAWKRTEAWLYIHRQQGRRLCFHLPSTDSKLPGRIALCLATALGVGLKADRTQT